jgi:hypothetical protein
VSIIPFLRGNAFDPEALAILGAALTPRDARPVAEGCMGLVPETQLLSRLPTHLATDLFASANPVKLPADQVLFLADDPGDSCYRVEDGLLKVTMVSRSGTERILSFISRGGIVGELAILDELPRSASLRRYSRVGRYRLTCPYRPAGRAPYSSPRHPRGQRSLG